MIRMECPECGHLLNVPEKYAGTMGQCLKCKASIQVPEGNSSLIGCPSCGHENESGSKFCKDCGASLDSHPVILSSDSQLGNRVPVQRSENLPPMMSPVSSPVVQQTPFGSVQAIAPVQPAQAPQPITIINQQSSGPGFNPTLLADAENKSPGMALFLSLLIVGLGQIYNGQAVKGILMFFLCIALWVALLGWIVNIWAMVDAYSVAKRKRENWKLLLAGQQGGAQIARTGP